MTELVYWGRAAWGPKVGREKGKERSADKEPGDDGKGFKDDSGPDPVGGVGGLSGGPPLGPGTTRPFVRPEERPDVGGPDIFGG